MSTSFSDQFRWPSTSDDEVRLTASHVGRMWTDEDTIEIEPEYERYRCWCSCGCRTELDPPAFEGDRCSMCSEACPPRA